MRQCKSYRMPTILSTPENALNAAKQAAGRWVFTATNHGKHLSVRKIRWLWRNRQATDAQVISIHMSTPVVKPLNGLSNTKIWAHMVATLTSSRVAGSDHSIKDQDSGTDGCRNYQHLYCTDYSSSAGDIGSQQRGRHGARNQWRA